MKNFIDHNTLFAFDLDGTLAPIATKPCVIGIPDSIREEFIILNEQAVVAVITGRSCSDALYHLGISPRYLIGNHGAEGLPGWENRENEFSRIANQWQSQLDNLLPVENRRGIFIENKGSTLSIHYRHVCNIKYAHKMILQAIDKLNPKPRRIGGKFIENLIPVSAPDKGIALKILMQESACQNGIFVGDDETDEDVFHLNDANLFTIRVGKNTFSSAHFYLRGQSEILRFLRVINGIFNAKEKLAI
ncbi:trehalose-6-phosphate phosphatase [hydrocarbon metagenome]|uniref:Trehalose-6-phosphate phosphatase n=1 Tax=hydrocarbon metagenome TaxID=938273 RepID=A0A0W8FLD1_9ZZZZ